LPGARHRKFFWRGRWVCEWLVNSARSFVDNFFAKGLPGGRFSGSIWLVKQGTTVFFISKTELSRYSVRDLTGRRWNACRDGTIFVARFAKKYAAVFLPRRQDVAKM